MGTAWAFDVDACLVDSLTGSSLRPGAAALLSGLRHAGAHLLLWSAGGAQYARQLAARHGIDDLFDGFHAKDGRTPDGSYRTEHLGPGPFVFVDDRPEDLPGAGEVIAVAPYLAPNVHDRGLRPVAARAGLLDEWMADVELERGA